MYTIKKISLVKSIGKIIKTLIMGLLFSTYSANGIEIDSMFTVFDGEEARFNVKNPTNQRIYLFVGRSRLEVVDGELNSVKYNKDNIDEWEIDVRPTKSIIEPGGEKNIKVKYSCLLDCSSDKDKLYKLVIVPTPYISEGQTASNAVQVAIGFSPVIAYVKKEVKPDYQVEHLGNRLVFSNQGSSFYHVKMETCSHVKDCQRQLKILPGRTLTFELPSKMANQTIKLTLSSAFRKYNAEVVVAPNASVREQ